MFKTGAAWPPDAERMEKYARYEHLYEGRHRDAFIEDYAARLKSGATLDDLKDRVLDYPRSIVDIPADLLVGQPPVISYEDKSLNDAWREIADRSGWDAALLELVQDTGMRGDGVLLARKTKDGAVLEPRPAYVYFPEVRRGNVRSVKAEALAWEDELDDGKMIVRVDRFDAAGIRREAYWLNETRTGLGERLAGHELARALGGDKEVEALSVGRSTLVHLPNTRSSNSYFGRSDLGGGLPSLFREADMRITQIMRILDKHASPKMSGPSSLIDDNGIVNLSQDYFGIGTGETAPTYLTWNAQLEIALKALDVVIDQILAHAKISPLLMGFVNGASYDSARAFKMQLAATLAKVARKGLYVDIAVRSAVRLAVALQLGLTFAEVPQPNVRWRDGLPKDLAEMATTNGQRIGSGTLSLRSAIMAEMDCDEQTADSELLQVQADRRRFGEASAAPEIPTSEDEAPAEDEESEEAA